MTRRDGIITGGLLLILLQGVIWAASPPAVRTPGPDHYLNRFRLGWTAGDEWDRAIESCLSHHRYRTALALIDRLPSHHPLAPHKGELRQRVLQRAQHWIFNATPP